MQAIREPADLRAVFGQFTNIDGPVRRRAGHEGPLRALQGQPLAGRFHGWRGVSGQRHVCTVFATAEEAGAFAQAIVIAVARLPSGACEAVMIGQTSAVADCFSCGGFVAQARSLGASEWHVHLLAICRAARNAVIADLQALADGPGGCQIA